jgi:glycosyltransferase A (GT-A) superfamily protein (DUF2064 family)
MARHLVLFAREPAREARQKGLAAPGATDLFAAFAVGWREAARRAGAILVVATPSEDRAPWRRRLVGEPEPLWIAQRGSTFGQRLENAARDADRLGGRTVLVGGDVSPCARQLLEAFEALERGADAVIAPAEDGGVSLLSLATADLDLLSGIAVRRRDVLARLLSALARRSRRVLLLERVPDVDGRRNLRTLARGGLAAPELLSLARRALEVASFGSEPAGSTLPSPRLHVLPDLRAPPRAA